MRLVNLPCSSCRLVMDLKECRLNEHTYMLASLKKHLRQLGSITASAVLEAIFVESSQNIETQVQTITCNIKLCKYGINNHGF